MKMLNGVATIALAIAFGMNAASAADQAVRPAYKAPVAAPVFTWSGCYAGGQVGYAWQRDVNNEINIGVGPGDPTDGPARPNGVKIGGFLGCNYQTGQFVFGIEGDSEWADLKGSTTYPNTGLVDDYYESRTRWQASLRPRIGYAFDRSLLYATGGVAFANVKHTYVCSVCPLPNTESFTNTLTGWTLGAGFDYAFTGNWFGRLEYRYADFGKVTNIPTIPWGGYSENHSITEHAVRGGVAYKF